MPKPVGQPPNKKKKIQPKINAFQADGAKLNEVLNKKYQGKRILLDAKYLYGRRMPAGEEDLLFQYQIALVNDNNETAEIKYKDKCGTDGDHVFTNYPDTSGVEGTIENYDLATFKDDHERYLAHIGRGNNIANDAKEAEAKAAVRTYEKLPMLTMIIPSLYIDIDWVASEYMRRCKEKAWDQDQDLESVKCWNLERLIDAETRGSVFEKELVLEDLIMELGDEEN